MDWGDIFTKIAVAVIPSVATAVVASLRAQERRVSKMRKDLNAAFQKIRAIEHSLEMAEERDRA